MVRSYGIVQHPKSGERYAVKIVDERIVEAAGPLHHEDSGDPGSVMQAIINNLGSIEDGEWLEKEINHG